MPVSCPGGLRDGADKEGGMKVQKHTVQWRLMLWGQWVQEPRTELAQSFSPFGKFAELQENSNARADGIIYEIIDGTPCPPDGGLEIVSASRRARVCQYV